MRTHTLSGLTLMRTLSSVDDQLEAEGENALGYDDGARWSSVVARTLLKTLRVTVVVRAKVFR